MTGAFEWLNRIFNYLWQFVPVPALVAPQAQVLIVKSIRLRDLLFCRVTARGPHWTDAEWTWWDPSAKSSVGGPGFHLYWPVVTGFEVYPVAYQTTPLVSQDIVSAPDASGKRTTFIARGLLSYEIHDLETILAKTYDPEDVIRDRGAAVLHHVLCNQAWEGLLDEQGGKLDTKLRNKAKSELARRGVTVVDFTLTSLAPSRVLRVVQSTSQEGELGK